METHLEALLPALRELAHVEAIVASPTRHTIVEDARGVKLSRAGTLATIAATPICPSLHRLVLRARADIIHIHHPNPYAMLVHLTAAPATPLVITYHTDIVRQRVLGAAIRPLMAASFARASAILVTSPTYLGSSPVLGRLRHKTHVVPLGIQWERFASPSAAKVESIRRRFRGPIVLAVGRLVYYKGLEHLIDAMRHVEATLVIVGTGPKRDELQQRAESQGIGARVMFAGDVEDVREYYAAADVFVLPSTARSEAFGLVQLEAMAAGVPVVNTRLETGVTFVSRHGETGLTVPPADSVALASGINQLLADPALRASLGAAGQRRVREHFSAAAMAQATFGIYCDVLRRQRSRAVLNAEEPA